MKKYTKKLAVLSMGMFAVMQVCGRFALINHAHGIENLLGKYAYSLICIYDAKHQDNARHIKDSLRAASKARPYHDVLANDIGFLLIDVTDKNAEEIQAVLDMNVHQLPSCALFSQIKKIADIPLPENVTMSLFLNAFQDHVKTEIDALAEKREEENMLAQQERINQYQMYGYYPYYSYYYDPYWYNGPYWGGWGWGGGYGGNWHHGGGRGGGGRHR
jgi:hypothetical protein